MSQGQFCRREGQVLSLTIQKAVEMEMQKYASMKTNRYTRRLKQNQLWIVYDPFLPLDAIIFFDSLSTATRARPTSGKEFS